MGSRLATPTAEGLPIDWGIHPVKPEVSVIIPVYNGAELLADCIDCIERGDVAPDQIVVVDDGSTDGSAEVAAERGAHVLSCPERSGPARARNIGARAARGDVVLFLDADVLAAPDVVDRVQRAFEQAPDLDAIIGSYDEKPSSAGFVSRFRNLLHCFVHHQGRKKASTFWSGCGAIRRSVFLAAGGFDETYERPAIEDIELGYRLNAAGHSITLDPDISVKHRKHWTLRTMIQTDIFDRGIPWTQLIWRHRKMPDDLNLRVDQRLSVALVGITIASSLAMVAAGSWPGSGWSAAGAAAAFALVWTMGLAGVGALNASLMRFLSRTRGVGFALASLPLLAIHFACGGLAFMLGTLSHAMGYNIPRAAPAPIEEAPRVRAAGAGSAK